MPIELWDSEVDFIADFSESEEDARAFTKVYRAGIRGGMERAMEACDREREIYQLGPPGSLTNDAQQMGRSACWGCAAAIRALGRTEEIE